MGRRGVIAVVAAVVLVAAGAVLLAARPWSGHGGHGGHASEDVHAALMGDGPLSEQVFLDAMVPHHRMAVEMAQIALQRTDDVAVREIAIDIIAHQRWEIRKMEGWRRDWFGADEPAPDLHGPGLEHVGMDMDMDALERADPFPPEFYRQMIPHHQGAVVMSERLLKGSPRAPLAQMARSIATGQRIEIERMKRFWRAWARRTGGPGPQA